MLQTRLTEIRARSDDATLTRKEAQELIRELCDEVTKLQRRREKPKFSLSDVMKAAQDRGWKEGAAEAFHDHYEMVGWCYGKSRHPIVKLHSAMATWERTAKNGSAPIAKQETKAPEGWPDFLRHSKYQFEGEYRHAPEYMRREFSTWKKEAGRKTTLL